MRTCTGLVVVAMLSLPLASEGSAKTDTPGLGGGGGAPFKDVCQRAGADGFLVGIDYRAGKALDAIQAKCSQVNNNGEWLGKGWGEKWWGTNSNPHVAFGIGEARFCDKNQYVTSLHVWWDGNGIVHHIRVNCHSFDRKKKSSLTTSTGGGVPTRDDATSCPTGEFAVGIRGRYGSMVDRIGLVCDKRP